MSATIRPGPPAAHPEVRRSIEHAAHYLPTQGLITVFVHHNTLHAIEDLPFEQAVVAGREIYGCEPYLAEHHYREALRSDRISAEDLREVLMEDLGDEADRLVASFGTRYWLRLTMLQYPLPAVPSAELPWLMAETDAFTQFREDVNPSLGERMVDQTKHWVMRDLRGHGAPADSDDVRRARDLLQELCSEFGTDAEAWTLEQWRAFVLRLLWSLCRDGIAAAGDVDERSPRFVRHRDVLLAATGEDSDQRVHEVLIRFCAAFVDQGFAAWSVPDRNQGFFRSFAQLYSTPLVVRPRWMEGLRQELRGLLATPFDALDSVEQSLQALGVEASDREEYIRQSLLALRGWAGMIHQLEINTPWAPHPIPEGTLHEYLAVRLILERYALRDLARRRLGTTDLQRVRALAERQSATRPQAPSLNGSALTVFHLAQLRGWSPVQLVHLSGVQWSQLTSEIHAFSGLERRRIFQLAYERQYHHAALDAVIAHSTRLRLERTAADRPTPAYQVVCCIDDREESLRRHLEEVDPECQTFGAAAFYGVAMFYQGAAHAHYRPLCPNIVTPRHYVREEPVFSAVSEGAKRSERRRIWGRMSHSVHTGSRTLVGGLVTGVFGSLATFPMVARILAPRLAARLRRSAGNFVRPPATELHLERTALEPGPAPDSLGYSITEMASVVTRVLQDIGLVSDFSSIVLFVGHGSSSMNNPHDSAYCCGACSGGRGGPNARAFAEMANDPRVRALVAEAGIAIPAHVRFIGAYHNTCNDHVEYYDLDRLPRSHRHLFRRMEESLDEARARNAHERARRFESAPLDLTPAEALRHVEERAEDLSQARPEYNHATNALCFVGGRSWSRGLYLDRRTFLTSYDPDIDDDQSTILTRILRAAIPVCAGINLEYYFSTVDNEGYGCGSKLPQNVVSLAGVMTGAASDLRPGLSAQMVEIHEPMRMLFVIETTPEAMHGIIRANPEIARLVEGEWVQLAVFSPETSQVQLFRNGRFETYHAETQALTQVSSSAEWYRGWRDHLGFASVREVGFRLATSESGQRSAW